MTKIIHSLISPTPVYLNIMNHLANIFMQNNPEVDISFRVLRKKGDSDPYLELQQTKDLPSCGEFFWHSRYVRYDMLCPLEELDGFEMLRQSLYTQFVYQTADGSGKSHIHAMPLFCGIPIFMILNRDICRKVGVEANSSAHLAETPEIDWGTLRVKQNAFLRYFDDGAAWIWRRKTVGGNAGAGSLFSCNAM